ncbi:MAG: large subunit ribosomal protein L24 [Rickettsiales bacterium]|jgi:large subunit ribosomal protein L24
MSLKFKKNDQVIILSGSSKGKIGNILSIKNNRVIVSGVNMVTFHKKPTSDQPGEIVKKESTVHISSISHIENDKPVKISFKIEDGEGKNFNRKVRISRKTGKKID